MMQSSATQGTQGTPPVPPIPKMEAGPSNARTRQQVREQVQKSVRAAVRRATEAAQAGTPGTLTLPSQSPAPSPPQTTTGTTPPPAFPQDDIPPQVMSLIYMSMVFTGVILLGFPLVRAIARRFDRRTEAIRSGVQDVTPQLTQLQESVDAMAVELERIGEAQRFSAKLLAERASDPREVRG
jgi:hypothetical protein